MRLAPVAGVRPVLDDDGGARLRDALGVGVGWRQARGRRDDALVNRGGLVPRLKSRRIHRATVRGHRQGARGVGEATTQAVVHSAVSILVSNYLLTSLLMGDAG